MNSEEKARNYSSLGFVHWPEPESAAQTAYRYYSSLGFVHWPERAVVTLACAGDYSSLGFVHWPEPFGAAVGVDLQL